MNNLENSLSDVISPDMMSKVMSETSAAAVDNPRGFIATQLSKLWLITDTLAEGAVAKNTQLSRLSAENTLSRQLSSNKRMLRYRRIDSTLFTDTMFANPDANSFHQNKCCQVFVSDKGYVVVYLMRTQEEFTTDLHWFCK